MAGIASKKLGLQAKVYPILELGVRLENLLNFKPQLPSRRIVLEPQRPLARLENDAFVNSAQQHGFFNAVQFDGGAPLAQFAVKMQARFAGQIDLTLENHAGVVHEQRRVGWKTQVKPAVNVKGGKGKITAQPQSDQRPLPAFEFIRQK
jgi:hypothetical protein